MSDETTAVDVSPLTVQPQAALSDTKEVLFRQVHPKLLDGDEPSSAVFIPNSSDESQLSADRSTITTAKDSYELYVSNSLESIGTFGVTVGEFRAEGLLCFPDPVEGTSTIKANPAHARVDFSNINNSKRKKVAKRLKRAAVSRGILYKP